jgi:phosphoglycerate kinase
MTVRDINVEGKKVLVRVDFNVPLDEKAKEIADDSRIQAALPTIKYLIGQKARVILCSHLGRPDGKVVEQLRLAPAGQRLSQILQQPVAITRDCLGPDVEKAVGELGVGEVLLLENVRFQSGEEENDGAFAQTLARLADVYVDDAFGAVHRSHASIVGVANYLPAVAGLLLEKEIKNLGGILENPSHPFVVLMGGAKVSDKLSLIENIRDRVDSLLIGGGMAATLLKAKSCEVGLSLVENDELNSGVKLMEDISRQGAQLLLPVDVVVAHDPSDNVKTKVVSIENIPSDSRIVDIGPLTIRNFSRELERCKTVFWNGPLGIHEIPQFAKGTQILAELLSSLKAKTVIGGGSTVEVVTEMKLVDKMTFVSTGGGASLRFLSGKALPGVEVLMDKGA